MAEKRSEESELIVADIPEGQKPLVSVEYPGIRQCQGSISHEMVVSFPDLCLRGCIIVDTYTTSTLWLHT